MGKTDLKADNIEHRIFFIRGQKVMVDSDLALLYGVSTKILNKQVKRNIVRFPTDFMFQLTLEEVINLRFQIGTSSSGHGGRRYLPYVFTEHGAVMLASVLNSETAVQASLQVVRAFVRLRSILSAHKELARKLEELSIETKTNFKVVFELIERYLTVEPSKKPKIGFRTK